MHNLGGSGGPKVGQTEWLPEAPPILSDDPGWSGREALSTRANRPYGAYMCDQRKAP
jgi:hypothetical protein